MASDRQLEVIQDLESAVAAIKAESIQPEDVTIALICDRAGLNPNAVRSIAETLKGNEEWTTLSRIKKVFEHAVRMPAYLEDVKIVHTEARTAGRDLPPTGAERRARTRDYAMQGTTSADQDLEWEAATMIRASLRQFSRVAKERIISTVSNFEGLGQ